jgi:hypothetical protein
MRPKVLRGPPWLGHVSVAYTPSSERESSHRKLGRHWSDTVLAMHIASELWWCVHSKDCISPVASQLSVWTLALSLFLMMVVVYATETCPSKGGPLRIFGSHRLNLCVTVGTFQSIITAIKFNLHSVSNMLRKKYNIILIRQKII